MSNSFSTYFYNYKFIFHFFTFQLVQINNNIKWFFFGRILNFYEYLLNCFAYYTFLHTYITIFSCIFLFFSFCNVQTTTYNLLDKTIYQLAYFYRIGDYECVHCLSQRNVREFHIFFFNIGTLKGFFLS